jgi:hypothetical protein
MENCLVSNAKMECEQCFPNYYPVDGLLNCIPGPVNFCIRYSDSATCRLCKDGYYLDGNECLKGILENCLGYSSKKKCANCDKGYFLYSIGDSTVCIDNTDMIPNCLEFEINITEFPPTYSCSQCEISYQINEIPNIIYCKKYNTDLLCELFNDDSSQIDSSSPSLPVCIKCVEEAFIVSSPHFLNSYNCVERNNYPIYRCEKYSEVSDTCQLCEAGFFLNFNSIECLEENYQVKNCLIMDQSLSCSVCKSGFYFESGECLSHASPLLGCFLYKSLTECFLCQENYIMIENECQAIDMNNSVHKSSICEKIRESSNLTGRALKNELYLNSCFDFLISNCHFYDVHGNCSRCSPGYYLTDYYTCEEVFEPIEFCEFYDSSNTCMVCQSQFSVSKDQKFCMNGNFIDNDFSFNNCEKYLRKDYCVLCEPGFQLNHNTDKCSWSYKEDKCQLHDIDGTCLLCQSSYQMNKEGLCMINQDIIEIRTKIEQQEE